MTHDPFITRYIGRPSYSTVRRQQSNRETYALSEVDRISRYGAKNLGAPGIGMQLPKFPKLPVPEKTSPREEELARLRTEARMERSELAISNFF